MNNQTKTLLIIGAILVAIGVLKPDLSKFININTPAVVDVIDISPPDDASLRDKAANVVEILSDSRSSTLKYDSSRLRDLYLDLAHLISLDGDDLVIKNTEEVRQANSLSGVMLRLDIKGKYANLASACTDVIIEAIGDDNINLSPELRAKAVNGFKALAWACNESSK